MGILNSPEFSPAFHVHPLDQEPQGQQQLADEGELVMGEKDPRMLRAVVAGSPAQRGLMIRNP
jgi:hypothetical protein